MTMTLASPMTIHSCNSNYKSTLNSKYSNNSIFRKIFWNLLFKDNCFCVYLSALHQI